MSLGIVELITLLLGLGGFGVQPNPKAPTPDASLQYAMPEADVIMHFDAATVVPNNYKVLTALPSSPAIKASPELATALRKVIGEVNGAHGLVKMATGIDVVTDVSDATVFVQVVPRQDPNFVAAVHGRFTPATLDKIAKTTSKQVTRIGGGALIVTGTNDPAVGVTRDGVLLAGTPKLVRDRLADAWKAPARRPGSNLAHAAEVIAQKPIYALVVTLSNTARKAANDNLGPKNLLSDMISRHKVATFAVYPDGIGWTWIDSSRAGLDNMETMSAGALDLLKAAHIAPRGFAKLALGAIGSYKGTSKQIDDVIRRKADIMKIVETYTGDGNFKTSIHKDPRTLKLTVRASGRSLSEVVPAGAVLPIGAMLLVAGRSEDRSMSAPPPSGQSAQPRRATPGLAAPKKKP